MAKRKIKIMTKGDFYMPGVGRMNGPIYTPFEKSDDDIFSMLKGGVKIIEVKANGSEKELTIANYKMNDNVKPMPKVEKPKHNPKQVTVPVVETKPTEVEVDNAKAESDVLVMAESEKQEEKSEEVKEETSEEPKEQKDQNKYNYKNRKK